MPLAYEGTDVISCLRSEYIILHQQYIIENQNRLLYNHDEKSAFMSENKLLGLLFEFAVAIVNLVDGITAPKSSYMTDQLARAGTSVGANIHEA